jgi:predicted nuclease of predicted toxin-antitoxin system
VARLLADENVPMAVVEALRSRGHDVATLIGSLLGSGIADSEILAMARIDQRVVLTLNRRDFLATPRAA